MREASAVRKLIGVWFAFNDAAQGTAEQAVADEQDIVLRKTADVLQRFFGPLLQLLDGFGAFEFPQVRVGVVRIKQFALGAFQFAEVELFYELKSFDITDGVADLLGDDPGGFAGTGKRGGKYEVEPHACRRGFLAVVCGLLFAELGQPLVKFCTDLRTELAAHIHQTLPMSHEIQALHIRLSGSL